MKPLQSPRLRCKPHATQAPRRAGLRAGMPTPGSAPSRLKWTAKVSLAILLGDWDTGAGDCLRKLLQPQRAWPTSAIASEPAPPHALAWRRKRPSYASASRSLAPAGSGTRLPSGSTRGARGSSVASGEKARRPIWWQRRLGPDWSRGRHAQVNVMTPLLGSCQGLGLAHAPWQASATMLHQPRPPPWRFVACPDAETTAPA